MLFVFLLLSYNNRIQTPENDTISSDRVLFSNEYDESAEMRTQSLGPRTFYIDKTAFYVFGGIFHLMLKRRGVRPVSIMPDWPPLYSLSL